MNIFNKRASMTPPIVPAAAQPQIFISQNGPAGIFSVHGNGFNNVDLEIVL
jgi:hypothetical protein